MVKIYMAICEWCEVLQNREIDIKRAHELRDISFYLSVVNLIDIKYVTPSASYVILTCFIDRICQNDKIIGVPVYNAQTTCVRSLTLHITGTNFEVTRRTIVIITWIELAHGS